MRDQEARDRFMQDRIEAEYESDSEAGGNDADVSRLLKEKLNL